MSHAETAIFAAAFSRAMHGRSTPDNRAAEEALESALWEVQCFKQAVRDREPDE